MANYIIIDCTCSNDGTGMDGVHANDCDKVTVLVDDMLHKQGAPKFCVMPLSNNWWCTLKGYCTRDRACND